MVPREVIYESSKTQKIYDDPVIHLWLGLNHYGLSSVSPTRNLCDIQLIFVNYTDDDDSNPTRLLEPLTEAKYVNEQISGWNPVTGSLFQKANRHLKWRIVEAPRLDTAISKSGKVVLIGDAYHGMVPHAGEVSHPITILLLDSPLIRRRVPQWVSKTLRS